MAVPQGRYEVRVYDAAGALARVFTDFHVSYTKRVNEPGSYQLTLPNYANDPAPDFVADAIVEIRRRVGGHDWYTDFEGFHTSQSRAENPARSFTSYGRGFLDLLARRSIAYFSGTKYTDKRGAAETVIKAYVNENAGPGATSPPRQAAGSTLGLTIEADAGKGSTWEGQRTQQNLLEVVQGISLEDGGVELEMARTSAAAFEFRTPARLGDDRTAPIAAGTLNAAGNPPVIFALQYGNMANPVYSLSRNEERNAIYVLGQGEGTDREVVLVTDSTAIGSSPWGRREASRQANVQETIAALTLVGQRALQELQAVESFNFEPVQTDTALYGVHYFVGDSVTAIYDEVRVDLRILGVTVTLGGDHRESLTFELGLLR